MMSKAARKRSTNFSKEEELLMLEEVTKFKGIIECKITNRTTSTEKNEAWKKVAANFNAKNCNYRSVDQLKTKYENLKTQVRKQNAGAAANYKGTGGGPAHIPSSDAVTEAVLSLINLKTVFGLPSHTDSDAAQPTPLTNHEDSHEESVHDQLAAIRNHDSDSDSLDEKPVYFLSPDSTLLFVDADTASTDHIMEIASASDEEAVTEEVKSTTVKPAKRDIISKVKTAVNKSIVAPQQKQINWSSYNTNKLKEPPNKRLRPKIPNPIFCAKEEHYRTKTKLMTEEHELMKEREARLKEEHELTKEREARLKEEHELMKERETRLKEEHDLTKEREARSKEEHEGKMALLAFQIKLAKNQLELKNQKNI